MDLFKLPTLGGREVVLGSKTSKPPSGSHDEVGRRIPVSMCSSIGTCAIIATEVLEEEKRNPAHMGELR